MSQTVDRFSANCDVVSTHLTLGAFIDMHGNVWEWTADASV